MTTQYSVKSFVLEDGERYCLLFDSNSDVPLHYLSKKISLKSNGQKIIKASSLRVAGDRLAAQQSEIDLLKKKHDQLIEKFIVWQYNAYKYGMTEEKLNEPLPQIDRNRTIKKIK